MYCGLYKCKCTGPDCTGDKTKPVCPYKTNKSPQAEQATASCLSELLATQADKPGIGDYCFASRWSDEDRDDPWAIGYLCEILIRKNNKVYYKLEGEGVPNRFFPLCRKITSEEGKTILAG